jgi:N-methylhydantoinase B
MRNSLNVEWTGLLATVYYAVRTLVGPAIPANAGLYRPIHVAAEQGTLLNAVAPAAVDGRTQTCQRIVDLIHGALAPAVPGRVTAAHNGANASFDFSGRDPRTGQFYVYLETIGGGFGARATKDGLDGVQVHVTNTSNLPIEALEPEYPLTVMRYALVDDSGGAGAMRGGMGLVREIRVDGHDCVVGLQGTRRLSGPWGLFGGREGGRCAYELPPGVVPDKGIVTLKPGDRVAVITPGAGGYGDPRERPRDQVARDLAEGRIGAATARDAYGYTP